MRLPGAVDLHFHGAFGVDLMTADAPALDRLAGRLGAEGGMAGFCPTTLSAPWEETRRAVATLGRWTRARWEGTDPARGPLAALPTGLHLEGPYLSPRAGGAHPPTALRPWSLEEVDELWRLSERTLRIVTLAPDLLDDDALAAAARWASDRDVILSLGHSPVGAVEARRAFEGGFRGCTHAWNAMRFHHRDAGPLGAALGRPGVHVEVILDQVHLAPEVIAWTRDLHLRRRGARLCWVSDCAPAAGTARGTEHRFGPLTVVRAADGASRLRDGSLAGAGELVTASFARWVDRCVAAGEGARATVARRESRALHAMPVAALGLPRALRARLARRSFDLGKPSP